MYEIMLSTDCGISYRPDYEGNTIAELAPRMRELDGRGLRWYLTELTANESGYVIRRDVDGVVCQVYREILSTVAILFDQDPPSFSEYE